MTTKFTQKDTKAFKGIAVMLMLAHHLLTYPNRMPIGYEIIPIGYISGYSIEYIIGYFGKICVSFFMFLGGYGVYKSISESDFIKTSLLKHIVKLYESLWKIMIIFIPIGFLFFDNQDTYAADESLCHHFDAFNPIELISNLTGWETSYNGEWWFFRAYICALLIGVVFIHLIKKHDNMYVDIVIVMIWQVLIMYVFPGIGGLSCFSGMATNIWYASLFETSEYSPLFLLGVVFAKYDGLLKMMDVLKQFPGCIQIGLSFCIQIIIVLARVFLGNECSMDMIYVPLLIVCIMVVLERINIVKEAFSFVGKYSTNMWLTHTFFCYYFYRAAILVYASRNGIVAYITLFAITLLASIALDKFWKFIDKLILK